METEIQPDFAVKKGSNFASETPVSSRSKTAQRLRYEAEVSVIKKKLGDLETIRKTMNLTQRKMAQLLLVDPSAWTRWTKSGEGAPPHIYRMLQWYLALEDKYPALDTNFWLSAVASIRTNDQTDQLDKKTGELAHTIEILNRKIETLAAKNSERAQRAEDELAAIKKSGRFLWFFAGLAVVLAVAAGFLIRAAIS